MSNNKKQQSISEEIINLLKPKQLLDPEDNEEILAKFEEFDENVEINVLSDIRKKNVKQLGDLDVKYKGKVVSRKELEDSEASDDDSEEENGDGKQTYSESESDNGEIPNEESVDESAEEEDDGSLNEEDEEDDEDPGDDYDISQSSKPAKQPEFQPNITEQDQTELLKDKSINEEVKKGICVQNQLKLWEKLLEVRIKSQKMLITANSLPNPLFHEKLSDLDEGFSKKTEETVDGVSGLLENLLELQSELVSR